MINNYDPIGQSLEDIINSLAEVTGCMVGFVSCDYTWIPCRIKKECDFCRITQRGRNGAALCSDLDRRAQIVAKSFKSNYVYTCYYGLVEIVLPVYKNNVFMGGLYFGQFLDRQPDEKGWQEVEGKLPPEIDAQSAKEAYFRVEYMSPQKIYDLQFLLNLMSDSIEKHMNQYECRFSDFERIIGYIDHNFQREITLEDLAVISNYNPSYISQMFRRKFGFTLTEYITGVRIRKAKELLLNSGMCMSEIAYATGFKDQNYFSRVFKSLAAFSPMAYRKRYRDKPEFGDYSSTDDKL